ncbi:hypothetical protein RJT34_23372 [Clitoria ternatea]|uniref:Uncharacterized protein n=1 Tax=Clitoria ternatea TaxID=43366 RepID=A0AAN9FMF7_CLITE
MAPQPPSKPEERDNIEAASKVIGNVFLVRDKFLRVGELAVGVGMDVIDDGGFEIDENRLGDVLARLVSLNKVLKASWATPTVVSLSIKPSWPNSKAASTE